MYAKAGSVETELIKLAFEVIEKEPLLLVTSDSEIDLEAILEAIQEDGPNVHHCLLRELAIQSNSMSGMRRLVNFAIRARRVHVECNDFKPKFKDTYFPEVLRLTEMLNEIRKFNLVCIKSQLIAH